VLEQILGEGKT